MEKATLYCETCRCQFFNRSSYDFHVQHYNHAGMKQTRDREREYNNMVAPKDPHYKFYNTYEWGNLESADRPPNMNLYHCCTVEDDYGENSFP